MRLQLLKPLFSFLITLFFLGSLLTTLIWYMLDSRHVEPHRQPPQKKRAPESSEPCKGCREVIEKIVQRYAEPWQKKEENYQKFSSLLSAECHAAERAIVTQANTPLGSRIVYSGESKRSTEVTPDLFLTFPKEHPFTSKKWETCSVVGNGGILNNSTCGKQIDSAQFVFRCNLPPLDDGYERDVGRKTDLVTANPSILIDKFDALNEHRRPFVESLNRFGRSMLLLPTFSYGYNTPVCLRAFYSIEDFESPIRPVFFNPKYLQRLYVLWRSLGLKEPRLSTGMMMVSLALELCERVDLYGFWPFALHPHSLRGLTNHYYDNKPARRGYHSMPAEFERLLKLHSEG